MGDAVLGLGREVAEASMVTLLAMFARAMAMAMAMAMNDGALAGSRQRSVCGVR
jgi:hypothetical protein